jgi:aldose 1-epimerase
MRSKDLPSGLTRIAGFGILVIMLGCSSGTPVSEEKSAPQGAAAGNGNGSSSDMFETSVQHEPFGQTTDGEEVDRYLLMNRWGVRVEIITLGAIVTTVVTPDTQGNLETVTLGYETLAEYESNAPYFGAICGRFANRIANGKFLLDGKEYTLAVNNETTHLHGGLRGFHKVVWRAEDFLSSDEQSVGVELAYVSPDGEEGYPGTLKAVVRYTLNNDNELRIDYTATTDKKTPLNLTSHCYWNLAGVRDGTASDIHNHFLTLHCNKYLPVGETLVPTGEMADVAGTSMDFTTQKRIGSAIADVAGGYDHCYVITDGSPVLRSVALLHEPVSGRVLEVSTTEPGIQLYTGNFLDGSAACGGFEKHEGLCLECQHFPDSPNQPNFPNTILEPGVVYRQTTVYKFSTRN